MASIRFFYLFPVTVILLLLCSTDLTSQNRVTRSLDDFEDGIENSIDEDAIWQPEKFVEEMEHFEGVNGQTEPTSGDIGLSLEESSGSAEMSDNSGSIASTTSDFTRPFTVGKRKNIKVEGNDDSIISGDEEFLKSNPTLQLNENMIPVASSGFFQENIETSMKESNKTIVKSRYQKKNQSNDEKDGSGDQNMQLVTKNSEKKDPEVNEGEKIGFSGVIKNNLGSGDLEDNMNNNLSQLKQHGQDIIKNLNNATNSSQDYAVKPKILSREELIKYLTAKVIAIRNESLRMKPSSEAQEMNEGASSIFIGKNENSKISEDQNTGAKDRFESGGKFKIVTSDGIQENATMEKSKTESTNSQGSVAEKGSTQENSIKMLNGQQGNASPIYHSISNSHFQLDKISEAQNQTLAKLQEDDFNKKPKSEEESKLMINKTKEIMSTPTTHHHDNNNDKQIPSKVEAVKQVKDVKQEEDLQKEKEKKVIEEAVHQSIINFQKSNNSKIELNPDQGAGLNQTKDVKQDEELLNKENEKKLIEESVHQTIMKFQKKYSSKLESEHQGASLKQTKDVKQEGDFSKEKEKKLIAESIFKTMKQYQKPNSSQHDDLNPKEPSFPTRYFGKKIEKAKKKYKEDKLLKKLDALKFGNKPSTVKKTMSFKNLKQCGLFVEEYNVSRTSASWNTKLFSQYSYLYEIPEHFSECSTTGWFNNTDMRGSVFLSFQVKSILGNTMMNNARVCAKYCCREPRCNAWTVRIQEGETQNCDKGSYCCWLKSAVPNIRSGVDNCTSGIIRRVHTKDPPVGMRSAVPLGGLTTGSFELRADGTFHEWTIENQSPGGSAKLNKGSLDMAVLGVRVAKGNKSEAALLRTHPPHGFPGVESLSYSGAYPVSKLSPGGNITNMVDMDLYAYPAFHIRNPYTSAVPAVAFTIGLTNKDEKEPVTASFLLNLPLGYQDDTIRMGDNYGEVVFTRNVLPADCARACAKMPKCMAWTTNGPTACLLKDKMPIHAWTEGIISGLKGKWNKNNSMLTLERPGFFPQSGSTTLYAVEGDDMETSFGVADNFMDIWKTFNETGLAGNTTTVPKVGLHGSASVRTTLQPGETKSLTIIMSWYYPHRDMAKVHIGNFYTNMFQSSQAVAIHMRRNLLRSVSNIATWQEPFLLSTGPSSKPNSIVYRLPSWLNDLLVNSVSFWRSAFWTKDGRWRQWEAYDCNDIDTIHNDMQRILPYMLFYPEIVRHLLLSWAGNQYSNGMMQEALTQGCLGKTGKLDYAGGRVMADSTSMFVVGVYQYYKWTDDKIVLGKLWSAVKRAITWLIIDSTKGTGLPFRKATFYDLAGIDKYDHHIYDSVIFVLALKASRALATIMKDGSFKQTTNAAISRAESLIEKEFWMEHSEHYRAWFDMEYGASEWIMSDSFYGQVWANTLGLGDIVPRKKLNLHLEAETIISNTPWGLRVISTNKPAVNDEDTSLILSHRLPGCKSLENITKHDSIWMGADADWASLMINLDTHPQWALKQAKKSLDHWRSTLNDQWNIHGLMSSGGYGQDGLPWASSHHNSHLVMWHIPLAISGQQYSAPDRSLTFWPKVEIPFELPFFVPTASGLIEGRFGGDTGQEEMFTFKVTSGEVNLKHLKILGSAYGNGEVHLKKGSTITWSRPKQNVRNILNELKN